MTDVQKVVSRLLETKVPAMLPQDREKKLAKIAQALRLSPDKVGKLFNNPELLRKAIQDRKRAPKLVPQA